MEHPRLARSIKVSTFSGFLTISDEEQKITATVRELFATEGFDVKKYVTDTQQQRLHLRRSAEAESNARIDAAMRSAFGRPALEAEEAEEAAGPGTGDETEWETESK